MRDVDASSFLANICCEGSPALANSTTNTPPNLPRPPILTNQITPSEKEKTLFPLDIVGLGVNTKNSRVHRTEYNKTSNTTISLLIIK